MIHNLGELFAVRPYCSSPDMFWYWHSDALHKWGVWVLLPCRNAFSRSSNLPILLAEYFLFYFLYTHREDLGELAYLAARSHTHFDDKISRPYTSPPPPPQRALYDRPSRHYLFAFVSVLHVWFILCTFSVFIQGYFTVKVFFCLASKALAKRLDFSLDFLLDKKSRKKSSRLATLLSESSGVE